MCDGIMGVLIFFAVLFVCLKFNVIIMHYVYNTKKTINYICNQEKVLFLVVKLTLGTIITKPFAYFPALSVPSPGSEAGCGWLGSMALFHLAFLAPSAGTKLKLPLKFRKPGGLERGLVPLEKVYFA